MIPTPEEMESLDWYTDPDEMVAFARWYWQGVANSREILDFFEKPWTRDADYLAYKKERT